MIMRLIAVALVLLGASQNARAEETSRGSVAAGYSLVRDSDAEVSFPLGWFASGAAQVRAWLDVAGEVSGNYKSAQDSLGGVSVTTTLRAYTFVAGPRVVRRLARGSVFGEILVGGASQSAEVSVTGAPSSDTRATDTNLCYQPGGGVDIDVRGRLSVRAAGGVRFIHGSGTTTTELQIAAGLVYRFSR